MYCERGVPKGKFRGYESERARHRLACLRIEARLTNDLLQRRRVVFWSLLKVTHDDARRFGSRNYLQTVYAARMGVIPVQLAEKNMGEMGCFSFTMSEMLVAGCVGRACPNVKQ